MTNKWSKMPITWQTKPEAHAAFREAGGIGLAALKLYIAICVKANFNPSESFSKGGCTKRSVTQLEQITGLSRPMVTKGLRLLKQLEIVEDLGGLPTTYHLVGYDDAKHWGKIPTTHLAASLDKSRLVNFPNRGKASLTALQLYLYVAAIRDRRSLRAKVGYDKFCEVLGVQRNTVSAALSLLVEASMLTIRDNSQQRTSNEYSLTGTIPQLDEATNATNSISTS